MQQKMLMVVQSRRLALIKKQYLIRAGQQLEAMRNYQDNPACGTGADTGKDLLLGFYIQGGQGIVNNQNRSISQQGTGKGQTLLLAAGKPQAALADSGLISFFHSKDFRVDSR
jgi:hypothetical protein